MKICLKCGVGYAAEYMVNSGVCIHCRANTHDPAKGKWVPVDESVACAAKDEIQGEGRPTMEHFEKNGLDPLAKRKDTFVPRGRVLKSSDDQIGGGHYKSMAIQPAEFCQRNKLGWCESNVIKYVCRHGAKNGAEDIRKAIHYLGLLLEWQYGEEIRTVPEI
jgi:hypothetical protein